ncbi:hypothetical protein ABW19_dt0200923 [Dactylella cylindrospora]|nr:hypothetical protein ABW19_dt0200923 [Dactylella cylindrospora]
MGSTNTAYATGSATEGVTDTDTIFETATETIYYTLIETVPTTATVTTSVLQTQLAKRQQTQAPSNIPTYASVCSGAYRYSSACSCVGVTATTTTLPAETTTVFVDETVTQLTQTFTTTVATEVVTVVDATNTVGATDATSTVVQTETATTTKYIYLPSQASLAIQVVGGNYGGQYLNADAGDGIIRAVPSPGSATQFFLIDGNLYTSRGPAGIGYWGSIVNSYFWAANPLPITAQTPIIGPDSLMSFSLAGVSVPWTCGSDIWKGGTTITFVQPFYGLTYGRICQPVQLRAVPYPVAP